MIEIGDTYDFKSITIFRVRIVEDKGRLRFRYSKFVISISDGSIHSGMGLTLAHGTQPPVDVR
jgi:hypothetical protein